VSLRPSRHDVVVGVALACAAGVWSWRGSQMFGLDLLPRFAGDTWFDADVGRVVGDMALTRESAGYRSTVHPLFILLTLPGVRLLQAAGGSVEQATAAILAAVAALWAAALYTVLRLLGCRRADAALFTLLGISSAAAIFWLPIRETYTLGSLSILVALAVLASAPRSRWPWVAGSAATLAVTITNWMVGLLGTALLLPIRRAVQVTLAALVLVAGLWAIQKQIVPRAAFFLPDRGEAKYVEARSASRVWQASTVVLSHSIVAPRVDVLPADSLPVPLVRQERHPPNQLSIQEAALGSAGPLATAATLAWLGLLGWGILCAAHWSRRRRIWLVVVGSLAGQLALHVVYGRETFLYAMHWMPLLIVLASGTTLTRGRPVAIVLAVIVLLAGGAANLAQFRRGVSLYGLERYQALREMQLRPHDPWPRSAGHVILAAPGTREHEKTYHEPGAALSPTPGSFGIALWVTDDQGRLITTSDDMPLDSISQHYDRDVGALVPAIATRTPYYAARWSLPGPRLWRLDLEPQTSARRQLELVVRSIGPAGGPLNSLAWTGDRLNIENRWSVDLTPRPRSVAVGREGDAGWRGAPAGLHAWAGEDGWGYARLLLPRKALTVTITSVSPSDPAPTLPALVPLPRLTLPDARFDASLRAGADNLVMSLVRDEARPADPMFTPVPQARSSAYVVAALARAGQLPLAKSLAAFVARNDFYGPHGAEADGLGLSIWALAEVADQLADPTYDRSIWPDVRRKAALITRQLAATDTVHAEPLNPPVPWYRGVDPTIVAEPAESGLIVARIEREPASLYVSGIAVLGLERAAEMAERVGEGPEAARLRGRAAGLRADWLRAFPSRGPSDARALATAVWPAGLAASPAALAIIAPALEQRWSSAAHRADWVARSLGVAEAHGWLELGNAERGWQMLSWFWNHQASPGLYTWAEPARDRDTYGWWDYVRGWVAPSGATPQQGIAAQILLLQLDMLAMMRRGAEPALVIGAGIPAAWLRERLAVRNLRVAGREVDWCWDGRRLEVSVVGAAVRVQPGPPFPPSAAEKLRVHHNAQPGCRR
jgi:hypothetical protein